MATIYMYSDATLVKLLTLAKFTPEQIEVFKQASDGIIDSERTCCVNYDAEIVVSGNPSVNGTNHPATVKVPPKND
jgi:hypothetical protein